MGWALGQATGSPQLQLSLTASSTEGLGLLVSRGVHSLLFACGCIPATLWVVGCPALRRLSPFVACGEQGSSCCAPTQPDGSV